ncbi:hypothetical protein [Nocardiopsis sp. FR26]|uniref:hypothetical protein n=1 Tax=Nocardiopsis sp. FR26 TaxID=2605987 RepID=UPI0013579659|nr:hypothetical protein [Nocardiopsis sp. FR26]
MDTHNTTITRDNTVDAYNELDYAETNLAIATELLAAPNPFEERDQADDIRAWFEARDAHRAALVEVAVCTNLFGEECSDAGLDLAEEVAEFTDRELIDCAPEVPDVPEFWPPREGDVWMTSQGRTWVVDGADMVAEDTGEGAARRWVAWFQGDGPVLLWRGGGCFLWVPVLRERFPVGARVTGPVGQQGTVAEPPAEEAGSGVVGPWWPSGGVLEGSHVWVVVDGEESGVWAPVSHLG